MIDKDNNKGRFFGFLCYSLLLFLFSYTNSFAFWGNAEIKGIVKDCAGKPIEGVQVKIKHSKYSDSTNREGKYSVEYVPGAFTVLYTKTGYCNYQLDLNLTSKSEFPIEDVILLTHPVEILISFWKSSLEENYSEAEKHFSSVAKEQLIKQGDTWESVMKKFTMQYQIHNVKVPDIESIEIKGSEITLHVPCEFFVYHNKREKTEEFIKEIKMVVESGCWKIEDPL